MMDKLALGQSGSYPGMPKGNMGGLPMEGPEPGVPGGGPEDAAGGAPPDLANIFVEWAYGKAAEAASAGNKEAGDAISRGIEMILQGIQLAGGENAMPQEPSTLPMDSVGPGGSGGTPTAMAGARIPFGSAGSAPAPF